MGDRTGGNHLGRRPLGVVLASALDGVRALVGKHLELARAEASEAASVRATGAGMMAAAAVLCVFAVVFIAAAASAALDLVLPRWAANLIVAVVLLVVASLLVLIGRRMIRNAPAPAARTREMLKEDARWVRQQIAP
ncbi:MAG TPA: phage holin family protein [Actinomycetota bacterium]